MRLTHNTQIHDGLGQSQAVLSAMWGLTARAQSQTSPGASALAVPHQQFWRARGMRGDAGEGFLND